MPKDVHDDSGYVDYKIAGQHMLRAYDIYKQYLAEKKEMQTHEYNAQIISNALKGLTNLKSVKISLGRYLDSAHLNRGLKAEVFEPSLRSPWGDEARTRPLSVAQLESILFGLLHHDSKIEELDCGYIHWHFFKEKNEHFEKYKLAVRFLKHLNLQISNRSSLENPEEDMDKPPNPQGLIECAEFLADGRLREFITAALHLMELTIDFEHQYPVSPAHLEDIVGNSTWPALRYVHFSHITVNEEEIIDFFT